MKVIIMLLCLPLVASAQHKSHISIAVQSATIWLGMPKADALRSLESAGLSTVGSDDMMFIKSGANKFNGTIGFTRGAVTYVDRSWPIKTEGELEAVIDAFDAVTKAGVSNCQVQSAPISEPDHKAKRIFIECGERSILLMRSTLYGEEGLYSSISERIGRLADKGTNQ